MTTYKTVYSKTTAGQPKSRLTLELTPEETASEPSPTQELYMFVGWVLDNVDVNLINKSAKTAKKDADGRKAPLGTVPPKETEIWEPEGELPLMAVVRTASGEFDLENRSSLQSFVLLKQHNGLCTPYMVPQQYIFYLAEFRDGTNDKKTRGKNWNDLVAKQCIISSSKVPSAKRIQLSKARDYTKLHVGPTASLRNEVLTLSSSYEISGRLEFLQELESVLEHVDDDIRYMPLANQHMRRFVDAADEELDEDELFTLKHAEAMREEMKLSWPDVEATPKQLYLLQRGISTGRVVVEYRVLKLFLRESIYQLEKHNVGEDDVKGAASVAAEAIKTIERVRGYEASPLAIPEDAHQKLLCAVRNKLSEMIATNDDFITMLKDAASDAALGVNFQDVWGIYAESLDTDAARKAFEEIVRLLVVAFRQLEGTMASKVQELLRKMDEARIG